MLDRCDSNTQVVIETGLEEARQLGHNYLGTEHLLIALVVRRDLLPAVVGDLFPRAEILRAKLSALMGGPPRVRDADLLKVVGIDLEEVRAAVRQAFGHEALDQLSRRRVHQPWQPWRKPSRRCTSLLAGGFGVAPRVKQALEHAQRLRPDPDGLIDPVSLLVGMIDVENALSNRLLRDAGIDPAVVRRVARGAA